MTIGNPGVTAEIRGSQLSTIRRLYLLIYNPRDAFALFSESELRRDAVLAFLLYLALPARQHLH